jgi:hypothetical protein
MSGKPNRWALVTILFVATLVYNLRIYEQRNEPIIRTLPASKELVATITGDPEYTIDTALLTFHSIGRLLKLSPAILTGRYSHLDEGRDTTVKKHTIEYTRTIPETLTSLGAIKNTETVTLEIRRREDVLVAEVLHRGPYDLIPAAIEAMLQSIDTRGYQATGLYEEVYLVFEKIERDPQKFETLLRVNIEPKKATN